MWQPSALTLPVRNPPKRISLSVSCFRGKSRCEKGVASLWCDALVRRQAWNFARPAARSCCVLGYSSYHMALQYAIKIHEGTVCSV